MLDACVQIQKLKSTYVDGMLSCIKDDHLSTHWDQTSAATGRLSSYHPNIQAIPKTSVTITDVNSSYVIGNAIPIYRLFPKLLLQSPMSTVAML